MLQNRSFWEKCLGKTSAHWIEKSVFIIKYELSMAKIKLERLMYPNRASLLLNVDRKLAYSYGRHILWEFITYGNSSFCKMQQYFFHWKMQGWDFVFWRVIFGF